MTRLVLALSLSACTLAAIGTTSSTIGLHNAATDSKDRWDYETPVIVSALVGLAFDIGFLLFLNKQWSKPMT